MPGRRSEKPLKLPDLSRLTLLVVDDNHDSVEVLAAFLRACGAHVLQARTGYGALAYVDTAPKLDAIVTDLAMPEMDGLGLLNRVRAHPQRSQLPVIALTGHYEDYANADGFAAFLKKPVDFDQLCGAIMALVDRRHRSS
jgi:CheY-like chemotaxis protein